MKLIFFLNSDDWSVKGAGPPLQGVQVKLINWDEGNYTVDDKPNPRGMYRVSDIDEINFKELVWLRFWCKGTSFLWWKMCTF